MRAGATKSVCTGLAVLLLAVPAGAQVMARRNWAGSGITVESWHRDPVLYEIDPLSFQDSDGDGFGDLRGITLRLGYLQSLGVDALLLSPLQLGPDGRFDPAYGTEDDFQTLVAEAARRRMRVLVDLPVSAGEPPEAIVATARFWLVRGAAGLRLTSPAGALGLSGTAMASLGPQLRRLLAGFAGDRVLLVRQGGAAAGGYAEAAFVGRRRRPHAPGRLVPEAAELTADTTPESWTSLLPAAVEALLARTEASPGMLLASDAMDRLRSYTRLAPGVPPAQADARARLLATVLLTARAGALLYFGQELGMGATPKPGAPAGEPTPMQWGADPLPSGDAAAGVGVGAVPTLGFTAGVPWLDPGADAATQNVAGEDADRDSLLHWYRTLLALHHGNAALNGGTLELLATGVPGVVSWLRRAPGTAAAPVLVLVNLSGLAVRVSLAGELLRHGVRTAVLRTLARSGADEHELSAPVPTGALALRPDEALVGELRVQPGLEAAGAYRESQWRHRQGSAGRVHGK